MLMKCVIYGPCGSECKIWFSLDMMLCILVDVYQLF